MNKIQAAIKQYVYDRTRGLVSLKLSDIEMIIQIASGGEMPAYTGPVYRAVLYKKNFVTDTFEVNRTVTGIGEEEALKKISLYKDKGVAGFYRWDVFGPDGDIVAQLFSVNSFLF